MKLLIVISVLVISFFIYKLIINYQKKLKKEKLLIKLGSNFFIQQMNLIIEENKYNLLEERRRLKEIDAYGNENLNRWFGKPPIYENQIKEDIQNGSTKFKEGIPYFWLKVIVNKFENIELFFEKWNNYKTTNPLIEDEILGIKRKLNINDWYVFIASLIEKSCLKLIRESKFEIENKHNSGLKFENYCFQILQSKGWKVETTPLSGDQGVDLIASIEKLRICIQCKDHKKAVGNQAVQEVYAGKEYWLGTHAVLVSRSGFTKSAYKLAFANKVILVNEFELENIENIIY